MVWLVADANLGEEGLARLSGSEGQLERLCNTEYKSTFATEENRLDTGRKHARLFYLLVEGKK
jgi:hypothetical protein